MLHSSFKLFSILFVSFVGLTFATNALFKTDEHRTIVVKSIESLNQQLKSPSNSSLNGTLFLFDNKLILNTSIDLRINNEQMRTFSLILLRGMVVSKATAPFILLPSPESVINIEYSHFLFYDKNLRPVVTCDEYLASYFDMDIHDVIGGKVDKTDLVFQLKGIIPSFQKLILDSKNVLPEKFCPLAFKNTHIHYCSFCWSLFIFLEGEV